MVQKYLLYLYKAHGLTAYRPREACPLAFPTSSLKENRCRSFLCIFRHGKLPAPCTAVSPQDCCTSAYVSICIRQKRGVPARLLHVSICQHTLTSTYAYASIRQYRGVPARLLHKHTSAYVYVSIRQHTYVSTEVCPQDCCTKPQNQQDGLCSQLYSNKCLLRASKVSKVGRKT